MTSAPHRISTTAALASASLLVAASCSWGPTQSDLDALLALTDDASDAAWAALEQAGIAHDDAREAQRDGTVALDTAEKWPYFCDGSDARLSIISGLAGANPVDTTAVCRPFGRPTVGPNASFGE